MSPGASSPSARAPSSGSPRLTGAPHPNTHRCEGKGRLRRPPPQCDVLCAVAFLACLVPACDAPGRGIRRLTFLNLSTPSVCASSASPRRACSSPCSSMITNSLTLVPGADSSTIIFRRAAARCCGPALASCVARWRGSAMRRSSARLGPHDKGAVMQLRGSHIAQRPVADGAPGRGRLLGCEHSRLTIALPPRALQTQPPRPAHQARTRSRTSGI